MAREIRAAVVFVAFFVLCMACTRTEPLVADRRTTPATTVAAPEVPAPPEAIAAVSGVLRNRALRDPIPGGSLGGYDGDTGLDILADHAAVFAIAAGTIDYAEWGHTIWTRKPDTAFSVRIALDAPIAWGAHAITHVYYTHMSSLAFTQSVGAISKRHVQAGERIGISGIGNGTPHLHLGLLLDGQVEQDSWTFILREGEVRKALGGYKNGERLPIADRPR